MRFEFTVDYIALKVCFCMLGKCDRSTVWLGFALDVGDNEFDSG